MGSPEPRSAKMPRGMQPVEADTWHCVPGYSSDDSDSEDEEEALLLKTAAERLKDVVAVLGCNWTDRPPIRFAPPPMPSRDHQPLPFSSLPPARKRWGHKPPPTFRVESHAAPIVRDMLLSNGLFPTRDRDFCVQWSGPGMRDCMYEGLNEFQHVNHFPGSSELTRKDKLWSHFHDMAKKFGNDAFDFVPKTYVMPKDVDEFLEAYERTNHLWIVKPSASSRGRGIFVLQDLEDLPLEDNSVVSRYVENPLLIQGLKFDLRVYVLVTSFEPLRAYVYREGLTRFASRPYSTKKEHMGDAYRHLTNYSINKSAKNFVENRELGADNVGHKWSLSALNRHLKCIGVDVKLMWARIMDLIIKSLLSVKPVITSRTHGLMHERENCFEIYGFDVLVDEDLKPWLLEVNLSPSMQADTPLDWQIKSSLLADSFNLVGMVNVDRQTNSLARMRAQRDQLYRTSHLAGSTTRSASAGPGRSVWRPGGGTGSSVRSSSASSRPSQSDGALPWLAEGAEDAAPIPNPVGASGVPERALVLDSLGDDQLKSVARSLQELSRMQNFVRLYPTQATVRRYAPIMRAQSRRQEMPPGPGGLSPSQMLASVLFGRKPVQMRSHSMPALSPTRASSNVSHGDSADRHAEAEHSSAAPEHRPHPASSSQAVAHAVVAGGWDTSRLLLLEYLRRICEVCKGLHPRDRVQLAQSAAFARLFTFKRRVQRQLVGTDLQESLRMEEGDPIDELIAACTDGIHKLERELWDDAGEPYPGPGIIDVDDEQPIVLALSLPATVVEHPLCQRILRALPELTSADLETTLQAPEASSEFRTLFESFSRERQEPVLPLSELLAATRATAAAAASPPQPPGAAAARSVAPEARSPRGSAPPRLQPNAQAVAAAAHEAARRHSRSPMRQSKSTPSLPELSRTSPATSGAHRRSLGSPVHHLGAYPAKQDVRHFASTLPSATPSPYMVSKPPPLLAKPPPLPRKLVPPSVHPSVYHRDIEL